MLVFGVTILLIESRSFLLPKWLLEVRKYASCVINNAFHGEMLSTQPELPELVLPGGHFMRSLYLLVARC